MGEGERENGRERERGREGERKTKREEIKGYQVVFLPVLSRALRSHSRCRREPSELGSRRALSHTNTRQTSLYTYFPRRFLEEITSINKQIKR